MAIEHSGSRGPSKKPQSICLTPLRALAWQSSEVLHPQPRLQLHDFASAWEEIGVCGDVWCWGTWSVSAPVSPHSPYAAVIWFLVGTRCLLPSPWCHSRERDAVSRGGDFKSRNHTNRESQGALSWGDLKDRLVPTPSNPPSWSNPH